MRLATIAMSLLVWVAAAAPSHAYELPPQLESEFDEIVDFNYRGSAQTTQPGCTGVCADLRTAETRPGGWSTPAAQELIARHEPCASRPA
jgi:hypothetical protein